MFSESLLESSPRRLPVLRGRHGLISALAGAAAFCVALIALPYLWFLAGKQAFFIVAGAFAVAAFLTALMACYVYADARAAGLSAPAWLCLVLALNLPGFVVYLIYSAFRTGDWRRASIPLAYLVEGMLGGVLVLLPLIYTQALPRVFLVSELPAPPAAAAPPAAVQVKPRPTVRRVTAEELLNAPVSIPSHVAQIVEEPLPQESGAGNSYGVPGGIGNGVPGGALWSVLGTVPWGTAPPPPQAKPEHPKVVRVGGQVQPPKPIFQPQPEYPPLARMARIQGTVRLEAIIGRDGTIQNLRVLEGHPLLIKAAAAAVERWRYQPTLLNGEPVDVLIEIAVNFNLGQ